MKERIQRGIVRAYLGYKRVLSNMKGSPTMEYIIVIAVGAAFAALLYNVFKGESGESIMTTIKNFVQDKLNENLNGGSGNAPQNPGGNP